MNNDLLYRYFMGTVTPEEGMAVKQWVEASDDNRKAFFRERRMFDPMLLLGDEAPATKRRTVLRRMGMTVLKVASVAALLFFAVLLYENYARKADTFAVVSVPAGQRTHITLPDGTSVWLNARSEIRYSTSYNNSNRDVALAGEAYFKVAKNKDLPFIVHTRVFNVKATGTAFNVQAYPGTNDFEAALFEGSVDINSNYAPDKVVSLTPGNKASWHKRHFVVSAIGNEENYQWRAGFISFRDESLGEIMKQFEKSFGILINIHNTALFEHTYTGKFRQSDGVDYALRVLQRDINFRYDKDDEHETINIY